MRISATTLVFALAAVATSLCADLSSSAFAARRIYRPYVSGGQDTQTTLPAGQAFASPQAAVDALVAALRKDDLAALTAILGPDGKDIIFSGDPEADDVMRNTFVSTYDAHNDLDLKNPNRAVLNLGADEWPMPIPIVKKGSQWRFDTAAGKREVIARRIGRNELAAIQSCLAYVDAQREYASSDRGDGVLDYAQRFVSTPGKMDGLYWEAKQGQPESPLGPAFAEAQAAGYMTTAPTPGVSGRTPFHGYYFKILTGQGPAAKGGAYDYLANGKMIGGYALVAYPATYGVSGNTTFIVNQDGVVYQQDLGPKTTAIASTMTLFNPGRGWTKA